MESGSGSGWEKGECSVRKVRIEIPTHNCNRKRPKIKRG